MSDITDDMDAEEERLAEVVQIYGRDPCECRCGYTCGGPSKCSLDILKCLEAGHFKRDCDHVWNGPNWESQDGLMSSVTCSRCGTTAMGHDAHVGP